MTEKERLEAIAAEKAALEAAALAEKERLEAEQAAKEAAELAEWARIKAEE